MCAGGRKRKFGEAYIPILAEVRNKYPDFLSPKNQPFDLTLPNGNSVLAKVCQQGSKALMSNPNDQICEWLFKSIDPKLSDIEFVERLRNKRFYTYEDLELVGEDAVKIKKIGTYKFAIEFMQIGAYEYFVAGDNQLDMDDLS